MNTLDAHALSGAYALDALGEDERATFERHLATCAECRAEVVSLREAAALIGDASVVIPPQTLREDVLDSIRSVRPLPPEVAARPRPDRADQKPADQNPADELAARRRPRRSLALAAAAALIALGAGVAVTQPWQEEAVQTVTASDRVLTADDAERTSVLLAGGARATVVRSASLGQAVLMTAAMPAAPEGKVLQVWLQDPKGAMIPAGLMDQGGDNKVLLEGDANAATAVGITVEPEGGSEAPTSAPVALIELGEAST